MDLKRRANNILLIALAGILCYGYCRAEVPYIINNKSELNSQYHMDDNFNYLEQTKAASNNPTFTGTVTADTVVIASATINNLNTGRAVWRVIASSSMALNTSTVTFSGLNGDVDLAYRIYFVGYSSNTTGSAGKVLLKFNNDGTAGNYSYHAIINYNATVTTDNNTAGFPSLTGPASGSNTSGAPAEVECRISAKKHGNATVIMFRIEDTVYDMKNDQPYHVIRSGRYTPSSNLTSIQVVPLDCRVTGTVWIEALR